MNAIELPAFLPGRLACARGTPRDYDALARFHYCAKRPATWAGVWVVRYSEAESFTGGTPVPPRVVAVAVLSYPTLASAARDAAIPALRACPPDRRIRFLNAHVRTISRVVVHPQFRGVGLASRLVRHACATATTRYTEAFARMARVHPFFEKGGMRPAAAAESDGPAYYLFDRDKH